MEEKDLMNIAKEADFTAAVREIVEGNRRLLAARATKPVVRVTVNQMVETLNKNIATSMFCCIHALVNYEPKVSGVAAKARNNGQPADERFVWPVVKSYSVNFPIGVSYAKLVNKQRGREIKTLDFVSGPSLAGMKRLGRFLYEQERTGRYHLPVGIPATMRDVAFGDDAYVDGNGERLTEEQVQDLQINFLRLPRANENQGIEEEVPWLTPLWANIKYLVVGGVIYEIVS